MKTVSGGKKNRIYAHLKKKVIIKLIEKKGK